MTSYSYHVLSDMLIDDVCWEGAWSEVPLKKCENNNCPRCKDIPGFAMIHCLLCNKRTSQCHLILLHGVCRVKEDHNCGYPAAHVCKDCFSTLNELLVNVRMDALLPSECRKKELYEPLKKWFIDNWNFMNK